MGVLLMTLIMGHSIGHGQAAAFRAHGPLPCASVTKLGVTVSYDTKQPTANFWQNDWGTWEPGTFKVFQRLQKGKVVLDVGGWIGTTALWSEYVAKEVFVMEPNPASFREIEANLRCNKGAPGKVVPINAGLGSEDSAASFTMSGDTSHINSFIDVRVVSIETLRQEYPELEKTGFVKIDTEGFERFIVPALQGFFKEKKPSTFVSLHPMFIGHSEVQRVVDVLQDTFPYLYEVDMKTPFNASRASYTDGDHGGVDVVAVWEKL